MLNFPLTNNIALITETPEELAIKTPMENGTVTVRPRFTRERLTFEVKMAPLVISDYNILVDFYNTHKTYTEFTFTDPVSGTVYIVRFDKPMARTKKASGVVIGDITLTLVES